LKKGKVISTSFITLGLVLTGLLVAAFSYSRLSNSSQAVLRTSRCMGEYIESKTAASCSPEIGKSLKRYYEHFGPFSNYYIEGVHYWSFFQPMVEVKVKCTDKWITLYFLCSSDTPQYVIGDELENLPRPGGASRTANSLPEPPPPTAGRATRGPAPRCCNTPSSTTADGD